MGFAQRRAEPAARLLAGARFDGIDDVLDQLLFLLLGLAVDQCGIVAAMAHPFPSKLLADLDDAGIVTTYVGVQRDGTFDAVLSHHVHHPPNADADAVVAPGIIQHVGNEACGHRSDRCGRPVEQEMLDIGNDPDRHARAVWPAQRLAVHDGRVGISILLLRGGRPLRHGSIPCVRFMRSSCGRRCACIAGSRRARPHRRTWR